jgi:hypothetical protein
MTPNEPYRVAILFSGDRRARDTAVPDQTRFAAIFKALRDLGMHSECAVYNDAFAEEVRQQLTLVDAVLVWVNPIVDGRDRSVLDALLSEVAASGVLVSAHPDVILKLGTKEVLYRTRSMGWGSDTHLYRSPDELQRELPLRLAGGARVLKQYRGHSGDGVWKVELATEAQASPPQGSPATLSGDALVRVRHAKRGSIEETLRLSEFCRRCEAYFRGEGRMIDQQYQPRLPEGMIRCYVVQDKVCGFGHQAINALYPASPGMPPSAAPEPGPRLYHPPTLPAFQSLKHKLEDEWLPVLKDLVEIETDRLPVLWDCDFLLGPKTASGDDTYVLCEINVSSVAPFPDSVVPHVGQATLSLLESRSRRPRTRP